MSLLPSIDPCHVIVDLSVFMAEHIPLLNVRSSENSSELDTTTENSVPNSEPKPLLTGYRLLITVFTLSFGLSKAIMTYNGQSAAPNTLDWLFGVPISLG